MKRSRNLSNLLLGTVVCFLAYSCADDVKLSSDSFDASTTSGSRTEMEAIMEAQKARVFFVGSGKEASRGPQVSSVVKVTNRHSRNGEDGGLYVVNFENDEGYAVIAANKNSTPVLAYVEEGNFVHRDSIDNPGMQIFLEEVLDYVLDPEPIQFPPVNPPTPFQYWTIDTIYRAVAPRVAVGWGQDWPEGYYCPNGVSGCVVTAVVQALSYFETPTSITLNYLGNQSETMSINWGNLRSNIHRLAEDARNVDISNYPNVTDYLTLAHLCREFGYRIEQIYGSGAISYDSDGTGTSIARIQGVLNSFNSGLNVSDVYIGTPEPVEQLQAGIIVMRGSITSGYSSMGHG